MSTLPSVSLRGLPTGSSVVSDCAAILRSLPSWFGIPAAVDAYLDAIARLPTIVADVGGETAGFLTLEPHNECTTEVHVMAVLGRFHRHGLGRALIERAVQLARDEGRSLLEVKTLGPSHPDPGYASTRAFYRAMGFLPVEERREIWGERNPCLVMVKPVT